MNMSSTVALAKPIIIGRNIDDNMSNLVVWLSDENDLVYQFAEYWEADAFLLANGYTDAQIDELSFIFANLDELIETDIIQGRRLLQSLPCFSNRKRD